jgi:hypothetical protein
MIDNARWWGRQRPLLIGRSRRRRRPRSYGMAGSNIELAGVRRAIQRDRVSPCRPLAPAQSLWLWIIEWVDVLSCLSGSDLCVAWLRTVQAVGLPCSTVVHASSTSKRPVFQWSCQDQRKRLSPWRLFSLSLSLFERERNFF